MKCCLCRFKLLFFVIGLLCLFAPAGKAKALPAEEDTTRRFKPRLVLLLTDTSEAAQLQRTQLFYEKLKNKFYRRDVTRQLYDLLFTTPSEPPKRIVNNYEAMDYFQQFEGKLIQEVKVRKLNIFGPSVNDTTQRNTNWLKRTGNALHFQTRDWVLQKNLLFEEGELVDPELLYDNERLLRRLSYIRDARIQVLPVPGNPDAVNILVITQDVFPLSFSMGKGEFSSYALGVQNNNIFGIGHRLTSEALYRSDGSPALGYAGNYTIENFSGSFINATVSGAYTDVGRGGGLSLQRQFYTPDIRWAGGVELQRMEQLSRVLHRNPDLDTTAWSAQDRLDTWLAHSFPLNDHKPHPKGRESIVLASRALQIRHHRTPGGELNSNDFFMDRKLLLGSAGWVRRRYRRDAFIYGFGRTEDVPLGALLNFTFGAEQQQKTLYYGQLDASWGDYIEGFGYLDAKVAVGEYFGGGDRAFRRIRHGSVNWISPVIPYGGYKLRHLLKLDYLYGDKRLSYEFVSVGDNEVRGISSVFLRGSQRLSASFESIAFTPMYIIGFRLAGFVFADVAVLNDDAYLSVKGDALQGYGVGVRVRNENLVFKTFQLRLSYYPIPGGGFGISLLGSPSGSFQDYLVGRPQVYPFR